MRVIRDNAALIAYACQQVEVADALLTTHSAAGLDLCHCGRPHPCAERQRGLRIRGHYGAIGGDAP